MLHFTPALAESFCIFCLAKSVKGRWGTPELLHSKIPTGAGCAVNRVPKDMKVQECCIKDDGRSITVAVQAEAVNRPSVLV